MLLRGVGNTHAFVSFIAILLSLTLVAAAAQSREEPVKNAAGGNQSGGDRAKAYPAVKKEPVTDVIHGRSVVDPYRWLEDPDSPDSHLFVRAQSAYTRSVLDPLPGRDRIHARLSELLTIGNITTPQVGGRYYFYTRREGSQNQPVLYVREGAKGKDRVLLDVNALAADGTIALDWWHPSHDGKYVAYGTSPSGSEISTLRILETATGAALPDTIDQTRAASLAWKPDDSGFYYTRYPHKGDVAAGQEMYNRHVFYHALGSSPASDPLVFGKGLPPQDWPNISLSTGSDAGRWLVIDVSQGWAKSELYLKDTLSDAPPVPVAVGKPFLYSADAFNGDLYIRTNEDAPRNRLFRVSAKDPSRQQWKEVIPQTDAVLQQTGIIGGRIFAEYEHNASSLLKVFSLEGRELASVPLPTLGTLTGLGGDWDSHEAFFGFNSFVLPQTVYRIELPAISGTRAKYSPELWAKVDAPIDSSGYDVRQVWFASRDATKVPMFIVSRKGLVLNGANPTILTGYGGFNISLTPQFNKAAFYWLEHGGVYAVANLRGGSEFGEDWHRAGMFEKKQNVFDDFIAAAEYLIKEKYTSKEKLAIEGGSNGGLLTGAALTQRPDLYRAVVCRVPLLDMLRYQNFQIARLWIAEYGSAENAEQFPYLLKYSPYQNVKPGIRYPAVLFMTAESDTRVDPMHAKKMAALLQASASNGADRPILLRIEPKAGHGAGKPVAKQVEEWTDIYSFLDWQLGVK